MSTYERRKTHRLNRNFIIFIAVLMFMSMVLGGAVTYALTGHIRSSDTVSSSGQENVPPETEAPETSQEYAVFGAYDDRTFNSEISMDWGGDDPDFVVIPGTLDPDLQEFTWWLCKGYNLDFTLVMAIMWQESTFNPDAVSGTNDYGLMQINKCNHEWLTEAIGVTDFMDPYQNIRAGTFILRKLFERYQDPAMVLMAYNMGETNAGRLWKQGIYSTSYSDSVLNYQCQLVKMQQEGGE